MKQRSVEKSLKALDMDLLGYDRAAKEAEAWETEWPSHCPKCKGWGVITWEDDPSPAGVSLSPGRMEYSESCTCVEEGECPRCGGPLEFRTQSSSFYPELDADPCCIECGWTEDSEGCPPLPEPPEDDDDDLPEPVYEDWLVDDEQVERMVSQYEIYL